MYYYAYALLDFSLIMKFFLLREEENDIKVRKHAHTDPSD